MKRLIYLLIFINACSFGQGTGESQKVIDVLSKIKMPGGENENLFAFNRSAYEQPQIKQRILSLLKNEWTEQEISAWINSEIDKPFYISKRESKAQKITEATTGDYQRVLDSLKVQQSGGIRAGVLSKPVANSIIILSGWLDMYEAIPVLKAAIIDEAHYYRPAVELALARLKVQPYHDDLVNKYTKKKSNPDLITEYAHTVKPLLFICSDASVRAAVSNWLYRNDKVHPLSDDTYEMCVANYIAFDLLSLVRNVTLKKRYSEYSFLNERAIQKRDLDVIRKLIKENQKNLILNRDYFNLYLSIIPGI